MIQHIIKARYIKDYIIKIEFTDGKSGQINLEDQLWGEVFEPLKNKSTFKQFSLDHEAGTITWPNGADFAPEFLYDLCE